jgi:NTP pyrophosphatase (non-canonical NTP hydrolase)
MKKVITLDEYQCTAMSTAIYPNDGTISYLALALCEEAGEAAGKVKKVLRDKSGEFSDTDKKYIALELGDCLWYIANLAHATGYSLSDIAEMNLIKIEGRVRRGTLHGSGDNR